MTARRWWIIGIIAVVIASLALTIYQSPNGGGVGQAAYSGPNEIAVIRLSGPIVGGRGSSGIFGQTVGADTIMTYLRDAASRPSVKAIILRMNTPGGSAAASQAIGREINRLQQTTKKVIITSMGDVAASGGYWIAATTDYIVANPASMTGSIGVIMQLTNLTEFYEKVGIDVVTIKSGPYKDIGSPARPVEESEKKIFQGLVDSIYQQFINVVVRGRDLTRKEVVDLADGRVFTGKQALEVGLVDQLGNFYDAVNRAAEMAGIEDFRVHTYGQQSPLERFFGGGVQSLSPSGLFGGSRDVGHGFIKWILYDSTGGSVEVQR